MITVSLLSTVLISDIISDAFDCFDGGPNPVGNNINEGHRI